MGSPARAAGADTCEGMTSPNLRFAPVKEVTLRTRPLLLVWNDVSASSRPYNSSKAVAARRATAAGPGCLGMGTPR